MFRIFENGTEIGVADKLNFIKKADNGCFVLCAEDEAQGIAFNGETFTLGTNGGIENAREVQFCEVSTADEVQNAKTVNGITFVTMAEAGSIDAVTAAEHAELFQEWAYPIAYTVGQIRRYKGVLYKCVQAHNSTANYTPDTAVSLWSKTSDPAEEWPEWSQPVGAHDAYSIDAKVSHNGKHWTSDVANNVWEPGVYGWTEVTE